jgi:hypothetical protein
VASGVRPAFLLDYAYIEEDELASAVATALRFLPHYFVAAAVRPCILKADDCFLIANLQDSIGVSIRPKLVLFASSASSDNACEPRWATHDEASALHVRFRHVQTYMFKCSDESSQQVPRVSLDTETTALTLPTLNGWLLGYPAVYVVHDQQHAQIASRCLSSSTLVLRKYFSSLRGVENGEQQAPVLAFSLPASLDDDVTWHAHLEAWTAALRQRHAEAVQGGIPWGNLRIETSGGNYAVAL